MLGRLSFRTKTPTLAEPESTMMVSCERLRWPAGGIDIGEGHVTCNR